MAWTEIKVCNIALGRIGVMRQLTSVDDTVASLGDDTDEERAATLLYEAVRDSLLEGFPWARAVTHVALAQVSDGTGQVWEDLWDAAYTYPADALLIRGFISPVGSSAPVIGQLQYEWQSAPTRWAIGTHGGLPVIFANVQESEANVEYIRKNTDPDELGHNFNMALSWALAAEFSLALQADASKSAMAQRMALLWSSIAFRVSGNEQNKGQQPDGDWVSVRAH